MLIIAKEILQYEKNNIKYYVNIPKIYCETNLKDSKTNELIDSVNKLIYEDIITFIDVVEDSHNISANDYTYLSSLTEFQVGYNSKDIMSLSIEFSQLDAFYDISYLKGYNYDLKSNKEIYLKDLFKANLDYTELLKKYILSEYKKLIMDSEEYIGGLLEYICEDNIYLNQENVFYFTNEYLILAFSSCEIDGELLNLLEFKIPFNKIYNYLSEYAIKNIVKKIIL